MKQHLPYISTLCPPCSPPLDCLREYRRNVIDQVVSTALPESTNADEAHLLAETSGFRFQVQGLCDFCYHGVSQDLMGSGVFSRRAQARSGEKSAKLFRQKLGLNIRPSELRLLLKVVTPWSICGLACHLCLVSCFGFGWSRYMFIHSRVGSVRVSKTFTALSPGV